MRRSVWLAIAFSILLSFAHPLHALDEIQGVAAVWNDFVGALGRGDYAGAHGLFSPQSRLAMPYGEFVEEYGPLSAAREIILAKPDSLATAIDGDWGEITCGGVNPGTGRKFSIGVSFVRNQGGWGLVAARNETAERVEAGARSLLRLLWENRMHGAPRDLVAALARAQANNPVLRFYRLETDGNRFVAFPNERALRTFFVDERGDVRPVEQTPRTPPPAPIAPREAPPPPPVSAPPAPRPDPSAMPELTDPGDASPPSALLDDWAEPPMPSSPRSLPGGSSRVVLPDTIQ